MKKIIAALKTKTALFVMSGLLLGFIIAAGFSTAMHYMGSDAMCANCHIMDDAVATHAASPHATVSCVSCHMEDAGVLSDLYFKATTGTTHLYYNVFAPSKIPDPLRASDKTRMTVQENCMRCHEPILGQTNHPAEDSCGSCHRDVPHGTRVNPIPGLNEPPESGRLLEFKDGVN